MIMDATLGPSVLLVFRAENARSFRDPLELSMLATSRSEPDAVRPIPWRDAGKPVATLPVAGIYGANASGKTNVLRAMDDLRNLVLGSFRRSSPAGGMPQHPFLLDPNAEQSVSTYEVDLVLNGVRHEYGCKITSERVLEEWAFHYPRGRSALLFRRDHEDVELGAPQRARGRAVRELLRDNALFLSTAAAAGHPLLLPLYEWFERNLLFAEAQSRPWRQLLTARMLQDPERQKQVLALLRAADLGITGARLHQLDATARERLEKAARILVGQDEEQDPSGDPRYQIDDVELRLTHRGAETDVELPIWDESLGTLIWFGLAGPVIHALTEGAVLLADELDASLHPALVAQLVRLFQRPETNPLRAQLIFNSHDTTVMGDSSSERALGRDQIWFTEKLDDGRTRLYALTDLDPRKDEAIARRYLAGRYGATPILSPQEFDRAAELITSGGSGGT